MALIAYAERKRKAAVGHDVVSTLPGAQLDVETKTVLADFGHTMQTVNVILSELPFDPAFPHHLFTEAHRLFVDVLVGLAGERTGWFAAGDELIARCAGRSARWVQQQRKTLIAYQKHFDLAVVDVEDHTYDQAKGAQPHRYHVHVARQGAIATVEARETREWRANPGLALAESARRVALPNGPLHKKNKGRRNDAEANIKRSLKHAGSLLRTVAETHRASGFQVSIDMTLLDDLEAQLKVLRQLAEEQNCDSDLDHKDQVTDINARRSARAPVSDEWARRAEAARRHADLAPDSVPETDAAQGGGVEKSSTLNDLTGSTVYAKPYTKKSPSFPPRPVVSSDLDLDRKYRAAITAARARHEAAGASQIEAYGLACDEIGEFTEWHARHKGGDARAG
jgi:hypothetical protein